MVDDLVGLKMDVQYNKQGSFYEQQNIFSAI